MWFDTSRRILTHPVTIIVGVVLGFVVGFRFPALSARLKPAADIYIALLSMCLLPILVSALIWGVGQILRGQETRGLVGRMAVIYALGLLIPCVVGMTVAIAFEPGASLGPEAQATLGQQMSHAPSQQEAAGGLIGFIQGVVPTNVFEALSRGQFISIVFFCMLVGLALGVVRAPGADETLRVMNALYQTFSTLFGWVLVPLALGLFCVVAYNISQMQKALAGPRALRRVLLDRRDPHAADPRGYPVVCHAHGPLDPHPETQDSATLGLRDGQPLRGPLLRH